METINDCISYPLAYIGADSVKMLDKFPIDPRELKERIGWATSNAFLCSAGILNILLTQT